jgi:uracil-DNA glycosylase
MPPEGQPHADGEGRAGALNWLDEEMAQVRPRVIVALGSVALLRLTGQDQVKAKWALGRRPPPSPSQSVAISPSLAITFASLAVSTGFAAYASHPISKALCT